MPFINGLLNSDDVNVATNYFAVEQAVNERHRRIAGDLLIAVVLHHDDEQMIHTRNALWHRALGGHGARGERSADRARNYGSHAVHKTIAPKIWMRLASVIGGGSHAPPFQAAQRTSGL